MHEKHHNKSLKELPRYFKLHAPFLSFSTFVSILVFSRLCGWWGQEATQRFKMESEWAMKPVNMNISLCSFPSYFSFLLSIFFPPFFPASSSTFTRVPSRTS